MHTPPRLILSVHHRELAYSQFLQSSQVWGSVLSKAILLSFGCIQEQPQDQHPHSPTTVLAAFFLLSLKAWPLLTLPDEEMPSSWVQCWQDPCPYSVSAQLVMIALMNDPLLNSCSTPVDQSTLVCHGTVDENSWFGSWT